MEERFNRYKLSEQVAADRTKAATAEGRMIEVGWISMLRRVISKNATDTQVNEMRLAFFMGASHVFSTIAAITGDDPSDADLQRLDRLAQELEAFSKDLLEKLTTTGRIQ